MSLFCRQFQLRESTNNKEKLPPFCFLFSSPPLNHLKNSFLVWGQKPESSVSRGEGVVIILYGHPCYFFFLSTPW